MLLDTVMDRDRLAWALTGALSLLDGVASKTGHRDLVAGYLRDAPKP